MQQERTGDQVLRCLLPIPLFITSKKKYCYLDPLVVFSGFLFPSSGDNCHQARPPRHALLLSDTSCWSHHSDYITWKLPAIAVLNRGFCLLSQQPGKGLNGQKKMECPVSQQSSLIPKKPCVSGRVKQCEERSSAPFSYMLPLWPEHSRGFHMLSWPDWCFPSREFTYKREHMNGSFISYPSCLC